MERQRRGGGEVPWGAPESAAGADCPPEWELLGLSPQGLNLAASSSSVCGEVWGVGPPQRVLTAPGVLPTAGVEEGDLL